MIPVSENNEYVKRVNRVLDYLDEYYATDLDLASLAEIANFSPYHFHRIFKALVKEPLNQYIQRIRIEKAAAMLSYSTKDSVTDIALACGFRSPAAFARVFKTHFGVSATQWRNGGYHAFRKNRKAHSNNRKGERKHWEEATVSEMYINTSTNESSWRIDMKNLKTVNIRVKTLSQTHVAYIRHIGEFKGETVKWASLFQRLMTWGGARGLLKCPGTEFYTVFRDSLNITDFSKFKADVCMSIDSQVKPEGEVGITTIPAGKYAIAHFEINGDEFEQAWDLIYSEWLPNSGYQPDERCCFERYLSDPKQHPQGKHIIEVCIPVKPL